MRSWRLCALLMSGLLVWIGCSSRREIHLVDGRSFSVEGVHEDHGFTSFSVEGWEYTIPDILLAETKVEEAKIKAIRRIVVTTNSIYTQGYVFKDMDDMFTYLDMFANRTNVVIVQLNDPADWRPGMRDRFASHLAKKGRRPYVGIEGYWKKE